MRNRAKLPNQHAQIDSTTFESKAERLESLPTHSSFVLVTHDLVKTYGSGNSAVRALNNINLSIERSRFTAIMGPSGSGKSTLMHCLAGLDSITSGSVLLDGQDLSLMNERKLTRLRRNKIGFIFQSFNLVPTLTAKENILLPRGIARRKVSRERFEQVVDAVGLADRLDHFPVQLSGGQQQRVACARALVGSPAVVFADEPTGNLDSQSTYQVLQFLRQAVDEFGQTVVMVTHEADAAAWADRVIFIRDGQISHELTEPTRDTVLDTLRLLGDTSALGAVAVSARTASAAGSSGMFAGAATAGALAGSIVGAASAGSNANGDASSDAGSDTELNRANGSAASGYAKNQLGTGIFGTGTGRGTSDGSDLSENSGSFHSGSLLGNGSSFHSDEFAESEFMGIVTGEIEKVQLGISGLEAAAPTTAGTDFTKVRDAIKNKAAAQEEEPTDSPTPSAFATPLVEALASRDSGYDSDYDGDGEPTAGAPTALSGENRLDSGSIPREDVLAKRSYAGLEPYMQTGQTPRVEADSPVSDQNLQLQDLLAEVASGGLPLGMPQTGSQGELVGFAQNSPQNAPLDLPQEQREIIGRAQEILDQLPGSVMDNEDHSKGSRP